MTAANLFACARTGDATGLQALLLKDRSSVRWQLNMCDECERTPLYVACRAGHTEAARVLLEAGAAVDQAKNAFLAQGVTALHAAAHFGHAETAKLLIHAGASLDRPSDKGSPLLIACQRGHVEVARLLVACHAAVDLIDDADGATALLIACQEKQTEVVRVCLEAGADVDRPAKDGVTPLFLACEDGNIAIAALLSEYGAMRKGPPSDPWTAESVAGAHGHTELVEWLQRTVTWTTPLHHIAHLSPRRTRILLRAGARLHSRAAPGAASPLELATPLAQLGTEAGEGSMCGLCRERRARESADAADEECMVDDWVRCNPKFAGRRCREGYGCTNRKCGFDHPRSWPHLTSPPPPPTLMVGAASRTAGAACEGCEARESARLVVRAAAAWSPEMHSLWPDASRSLAAELVRMGWLVSRAEGSPGPFVAEEQAMMDVWRSHIIPLVLHGRY